MEKELTSAIAWTFLDDLNEGVIIAETDGTVVYSNQAANVLLGLSKDSYTPDEVYQVLALQETWHSLLTPPAETIWHLSDGRFLRLQSSQQTLPDQDYIQILVNPHDAHISLTPTKTIEQLTALTHISNEPDFDRRLHLIVNGLQQIGWNRVILSLRDHEFNPTQIITTGFNHKEEKYLADNQVPAELWLQLFTSDDLQHFRQGAAYFVPGNSQWSKENLKTILPDDKASNTSENAWHPKDILCVPLYDRQQRRIGLLGLDQPANGRRPDSLAIQTIELYARFAASIIENAQLFKESADRNREFEILLEASNALSSTLETDSVFSVLEHHIMQAIDADGFTIYQVQTTRNNLIVLKDVARDGQETIAAGTAIPVTESNILEEFIREQKPITIHIGSDDKLPIPQPKWLPKKTEFTCALLPLILSEETYGIVHVVKLGVQKQFTEREIQLLAGLTNQASAALETALIFEDTYERERFYGALGNVSLALNFTLDREAVLNLICRESLRIFNVDGAYVWLHSEGIFVGSAAKGHDEEAFIDITTSIDDTRAFVIHVARAEETRFVNHIQQHEKLQLRLPHPEKIQAVLGVPLEQEGNLIGILILVDTKNPDRFNDKDVSWATTFGVQVAIALQNAILFEELREFNEKLDMRVAERTRALHEESNRVKILLRITTELSASLDQDRVLNKALDLVNDVVNATEGVILLIDNETGELIFRAALNADRPVSPQGIPSGLMRDQGLAGWMIENRSAVIVHDTQEDPRWVERPTSRSHRSVLGVPLISNEEVIGVLMMFHTEPNAFTMQQLDLVEAAAIQVANAINNASLYLLIFDQAEQLGSMLRTEIIQKANFQAIVESIADGVIVADNNNMINIANVPACTILDIPHDQLIGKTINELLGLYSQFGESWVETIEEWSKNSDRVEQWTYLADQLNIEDKFISVLLSPVLSDNHFYGTVSIFRDITKEVEVDRLKSEFVSTVSHELRTPMTSIKGYADLMLMGAAGEMSDPQIRYLQVIKDNADRLHMLVNDLLNISRIETGKTALDLRPLDIPQIINQVVEGHLQGRIQHSKKQLNVSSEMATSLPLVNADYARVTQILTNLLDNAFNYTPEGGDIHINVEASKKYVFISISDTGIGIAPDNQEKIFDRFFRAEDETVQKVPGTGLGLAIVRSLIEMHGGHLELESEIGKGSTFTFNLPVVVEDSDPT